MSNNAVQILFDPSIRKSNYDKNIAQYLVDLHDTKSTFNFCGGMLFQLVLTESLRNHLLQVAAGDQSDSELLQPVIYPASCRRMHHISGYNHSAHADNINLFHGREIRHVVGAEGGMGFVLQLSLANSEDPEGWTPKEIADYNGWAHDTGRPWRNPGSLSSIVSRFGERAYSLHHRFYLHLDQKDQMWLSAEDGCEGYPFPSRKIE
jgi:hypothetical protein